MKTEYGNNPVQGIAIFVPLSVALPTILGTIVVHGLAVLTVVYLVRHEYRLGHAGIRFWRDLLIVSRAILLALLAHLIEIAIWALVFELCGEFSQLSAAVYHSAVNYTSLGYGDVVMSPPWRLLGPLETADGMLMFGVSTAMIFAVIERLVQTKFKFENSPP
jgi:Ion channel